MAEILGIGMTHYPALRFPNEKMTSFLRVALDSGKVPDQLLDERNWPEPMRREWGEDQGLSAAAAHRERLVTAIRTVRNEIDKFKPDFILILGDDQFENFTEECIPPFCVFILNDVMCKPFKAHNVGNVTENIWGEHTNTEFLVRTHPFAAKELAKYLINNDFDTSYAYRSNLEIGLAHAFINTILFLDYDRKGFSVPIIPFHINTYGSRVVQMRGGWGHLTGRGGDASDPPGPTPRRCFDIGRAISRFFMESEWRMAIIASASWSHAFQNPKGHWINPDIEGDRVFCNDLRKGRFERWRDLSSEELEANGNVEFLSWVVLAGAMSEANQESRIIDYIETHIFNSNKCFALFAPHANDTDSTKTT